MPIAPACLRSFDPCTAAPFPRLSKLYSSGGTCLSVGLPLSRRAAGVPVWSWSRLPYRGGCAGTINGYGSRELCRAGAVPVLAAPLPAVLSHGSTHGATAGRPSRTTERQGRLACARDDAPSRAAAGVTDVTASRERRAARTAACRAEMGTERRARHDVAVTDHDWEQGTAPAEQTGSAEPTGLNWESYPAWLKAYRAIGAKLAEPTD